MKLLSPLFSSLWATTFAIGVLADIDPIVIKGSKFFFKSNGTQFFLRGIAYQQEIGPSGASSSSISQNGGVIRYKDPLADVNACKRDIPYLMQLRTNTIRVYAVDPSANHDDCMKMLADAGIYVIADLSQPELSINRNTPLWSTGLYSRYTSVIDSLAKYNNVLGFFAGNEVSNAPNNTDASAFVKAAVRDSKAYIKARNYRPIGVGYATNDDEAIRENLAAYFNCGDPEEAIDFWGYNIYSWCGQSSYTESGYDQRTRAFERYSVPVFFAEYGCNEIHPRPFTEVAALYGPQMSSVWSGGIVYMYFEEANHYGLVSLNGNSVSKLPDFTALSTQIAKATPTSVAMKMYTAANTAPAACPTVGREWAAKSTPLPPPANEELCDCMYSNLSCIVSDALDSNKYGKLFGTVCGMSNEMCAGIANNATTGTYGAYSMCTPKQQLSFALNQYANSQKNNADACKFNGAATSRSGSSLSPKCKALLTQAGPNGQGTVSPSPPGATATGGTKKGAGTRASELSVLMSAISVVIGCVVGGIFVL